MSEREPVADQPGREQPPAGSESEIDDSPTEVPIIDTIKRWARFDRGFQYSEANEMRRGLIASIELAAEELAGKDRAPALRQSMRALSNYKTSTTCKGLDAVVRQHGQIPEVAGLIVGSIWCRRDTMALLIEQQAGNPDFEQLLDIYGIDAQEVIRANRAETARTRSLDRISRLTEGILSDFGIHTDSDAWKIEASLTLPVPGSDFVWPHCQAAAKLDFQVSQLTPAFYERSRYDTDRSWQCHVEYIARRTGRAAIDRSASSQVALPYDRDATPGFQVHLLANGLRPGYHLLSEAEAQALISDLGKFYESKR